MLRQQGLIMCAFAFSFILLRIHLHTFTYKHGIYTFTFTCYLLKKDRNGISFFSYFHSIHIDFRYGNVSFSNIIWWQISFVSKIAQHCRITEIVRGAWKFYWNVQMKQISIDFCTVLNDFNGFNWLLHRQGKVLFVFVPSDPITMLISPENSVIWQNSRWKREMEIPSGGNINNVVVGNFVFQKCFTQ